MIVWIVGCGGESAWQPSTQEIAACRAFLGATCDQVARCAPAIFDAFEGDREACIASRLDDCTKQYLPGARVEAEDVATCASTFANWTCEAAIRVVMAQDDACLRVPGERADGEACDVGPQCASTYCAHDSAANCGVCVPAPIAGGSCGDGTCPPGMACGLGGCVPLHDIGEPCGQTARCFADLQCSVSKTCEPTFALGAACDAFAALNPCGFGNFCNEKTFVCERQRIGTSTCGRTADGGLVMCAAGTTCKLSGAAGTCIAVPGECESCAQSVRGPNCAIGLVCEAGICVAMQSAEEALVCE